MKKIISSLFALFIIGCSSVFIDENDLLAWKNVPVEQLDTHSFFITIPMIKTITDSGIEIRNYRNGRTFSQCNASGSVNEGGYLTYNAFATCSNNEVVCNNIFYIKDSMVIDYKLVGRCRTAEFLRPEYRF